MKYKVRVYSGFGEGYDKFFRTKNAALKFQEKIRAEGGPKHFVTLYEKRTEYKEIG